MRRQQPGPRTSAVDWENEEESFMKTVRKTICHVDGACNTFQVDGLTEPVHQVNNGANVLEANVVPPVHGLGALVPDYLGAMTQENWGGNVGL